MSRDLWWRNMSACKWRNLELQVKRLGDNLERRWAEHQYPNVDGADVEDNGRRPRTTQVTAIFSGESYLSDLSNLLGLVADGKAGSFQHPFLGTWRARVSVGAIDHSESRRNACMVELQVVESTAGGDVDPILTVHAYKVELTTWIEAVVDAADDLDDLLDDIEGAVDAVNDAVAAARALVTNIQARAASVVQRMNTCIRKLDKAVKQAEKLGDVDSYPLTKALKRTSRSAQKLGRRALGAKWPIRSRSTNVPMPAVILAHQLFGDAARADELMELNPHLANPGLIPAGAQVKAFNS